jgi:hypothetical protein
MKYLIALFFISMLVLATLGQGNGPNSPEVVNADAGDSISDSDSSSDTSSSSESSSSESVEPSQPAGNGQ